MLYLSQPSAAFSEDLASKTGCTLKTFSLWLASIDKNALATPVLMSHVILLLFSCQKRPQKSWDNKPPASVAEITADAEHLQPKHRSSDDALAQCFPPGEASVSHLPRVAPNPFYPKGLPKTRCSPTNPFPIDSTVWTSAGRNGHYVIEHNFPPHFPGLFIELCPGKYQVSWLLFCQTNPEQLQKWKNSLPQGCSYRIAPWIIPAISGPPRQKQTGATSELNVLPCLLT